jgi:hypothetical protein
MAILNDEHKRATKQALASLVLRHGYAPIEAAVGVVEATVHFGLQVGDMGRVDAMTAYAARLTDGPNAGWDTLPLSGTLVRRAKLVVGEPSFVAGQA